MKNKIPIIDGHNDSLFSLIANTDIGINAFLEGRPNGHLDLPRAKRGGLSAGFFALAIPDPPKTEQDGRIQFTELGYEVPLAISLLVLNLH